MKYAEMQRRAKARKDADAELELEASPSQPSTARSSSPPAFTLFKSTSKANRAEYIGHVLLPDGRLYAIEANVSEHDRGDGTKGKHFEGQVFGGQHLVREMLKGAKVDGTLPPDLVTLMEGTPFDDSLKAIK